MVDSDKCNEKINLFTGNSLHFFHLRTQCFQSKIFLELPMIRRCSELYFSAMTRFFTSSKPFNDVICCRFFLTNFECSIIKEVQNTFAPIPTLVAIISGCVFNREMKILVVTCVRFLRFDYLLSKIVCQMPE